MPTPKKSPRLERMATAIVQSINQYLIHHIEDRRLKQAYVNRVEVSKDLSFAKIYFTLSKTHCLQADLLDAKILTRLLDKASGLFRHHLAETLNWRVTPALKFYYDETGEKTDRLLTLLGSI